MDPGGLTPTGGTALIVVPGVGDDAPGDTVGSMTTALLRELGDGAGSTPFRRSIVVPPRPGSGDPRDVHEVHCALVVRPGEGRPPLVVYEMHWADLSRFPGKAWRFLLTLYGMLFQVSTIGLEALRADERANRSRRRILVGFSYLTAVLAVGLTAGAAILGVEFAAMLRVGHGRRQLLVAAAALLVALALAAAGDAFLRAKGWRFREMGAAGRPLWAFLAIAIALGGAPLVLYACGRSPQIAVHQVLWFGFVVWALPVAWALVGVAALAISVVMAWTARNGAAAAGARFRATRTAVLSVVVGGLGIALLGALLVALALGVTSRAVGTGTAVPAEAAADVHAVASTAPCGAATAAPCTPGFADYSEKVFSQSLRPLGLVLLCALALIAALACAAFPYGSAVAQARRRPAAPLDAVVPLAAGVLGAGAIVALAFASSRAADAVAVALAVPVIGAVGYWWARRFRPDPARTPLRRGFDGLLRYLGGGLHVVLLVAALLVSAAALLAVVPWTDPGGPPDTVLDDLSEALLGPLAGLAGGTNATTAAASAVAIIVTALAGFLVSRLPLIAKGLDVAYDVATYMRIPHQSPGDPAPVEPPRRRVLRRYATLIEHIQLVQAPERIVIAAHSQGSMYSLAMLIGDDYRDVADRKGAPDWPLAPRVRADEVAREPAPAISGDSALLTAGCPILQTYSPNFPGQYEWPGTRARALERLRASGVGEWRNVYRSGDYFGRALWSRTCDPEFAWGPLSEKCLGPGHHTGYWSDPRFAREVLALL